jgi:tetratricopeptide (TPR) repeat protein
MNSMRPRPSLVGLLAFLSLSIRSVVAQPPSSPALDARQEFLAARYENAASLFLKVVANDPANGDAWCGLVQAQLAAHHSREAYAAAQEALKKAPQSVGAETAMGFANFRRGDLPNASHDFETALKLDPNYPPALVGLAKISSAVSMFRTAQNLGLRAWRLSPDNPSLALAYASTLKPKERIAALEAAYATLDPATEQARALAARIAGERALGDRKLRRLVSPYQTTELKMFPILDGPRRWRGVGLDVRLNGKHTVHLLVDTGASGIAISPKMAEKAGLEIVNGAGFEAKGIGDGAAQSSLRFIAQDLRIGDVAFADYPLSAFQSAKSADVDGLIGADVFRRFIVKIDFNRLVMSLATRPNGGGSDSGEDEAVDHPGNPPAGFSRVFRFGDHLAVPTNINDGRPVLFLVDTGSTLNIIDTETAREFTRVTDDSRATVKGLQGTVHKTLLANGTTLLFAGFRQVNPALVTISLEPMSDGMGVGFGGILGMPVLGHLAVTIDYLEGAIRFEYNQPH